MSVLFASSDRAPATYTKEFGLQQGKRGLMISVNYTAEGGVSSVLDVKLQHRDGAGGTWDDIPGAAFAQFTGVADSDLMIYPGIAAIANRQVAIACPKALRLVAVVGTTNVTFSVNASQLD